MSTTSLPFLLKYSPHKLEDFVFERNHQYDLLDAFFKKPKLSHWYLYGEPGLGKTALANLMAKRLVDNASIVWDLVGGELNLRTLSKIKDCSRYAPMTGLFHAVRIDEAETIPHALRANILKALDLENLSEPRHTCWIFTCNEESKTAFGNTRFGTRMNRIKFSKDGLSKLAIPWLINIADLEGFVLTSAQASAMMTDAGNNNIREALAELDRRCSSGRLPLKPFSPKADLKIAA